TAQEFQNVKNILKELDAVPRQVLIEAMVLQVDLSDSESLGVDYEILRRNPSNIFGQKFGSAGAIRSLGDLFPSAPATGLSGFGGGVSGVFGGKDIRAFVNALMTDSRVKLISSPSVLAADNRPARIQVGTEEPIATGTINAAVGAATPSSSTTIQYRNTGRILTIIPQVNSKGLVNLQVKAEVSARGDDVPIGASGETFPSFNTQDAETTAVVHDGETLVIGGLIGERKSKTRSGIPYLMNLPVVGRFFGTTTDESKRTELIMLITPHVIRNREESQIVTEEFKNKISSIRNELERIRRDREIEMEKMKRLRREPPMPALPTTPPAVEPQPPPVTAPARPGTYFGPLNPSVAPAAPLIESAVGRDDLLPPAQTQGDLEAALVAIEAVIESAKGENPIGAAQASETSSERIETPSIARVQTDKSVTLPTKVTRVWVVQVASLAQAKDADRLATKLRDKGYDAHVIAADVGGKNWHRVQVGELASRQEAFDLQKKLKSSEKLEQAFVARR
ncbi:MAG: SPOR domain-containing protein, partial [Deltaproteobacteria bacterium]|nr:SPOR domain-containing protein [Deltaproteobacteria bacterium]